MSERPLSGVRMDKSTGIDESGGPSIHVLLCFINTRQAGSAHTVVTGHQSGSPAKGCGLTEER